MQQIAVSSWSLRQCLGPVHMNVRGPDGQKSPFTLDLPQTMTLLEFPRAARERFGLSAVEICQFQIPEHTPDYVAALKRALQEAEVELLNVPIDAGNISDPNPAHREEDLREIEGWMRVAADLGARMVRVNASGGMPGTPHAPLEVTLESLRRLGHTANELGLKLLTENHGGITSDPEVVVQIIEAARSAGVGLLLDIGNFEPLLSVTMATFLGQQPPAEVDVTPIYAAVARLAPYAALVHAKTLGFDADGKPIYLDVTRALRAVRDAGYHGPISLEYEGNEGDPWENTARTRALVEQSYS
jgi:sugar phosphate isomerase/epimerase